jgi:hypothetical protein
MSTKPRHSEERAESDSEAPLARDDAREADQPLAQLFPARRAAELRERWRSVQARFVDDPGTTVKEADGLVAEVLEELEAGFRDARSSLERQWNDGDDASTEDLRVALQRYRSFFERLLAV